MKKRLIISAALAVSIVMILSGIAVYAMALVSVNNTVRTGAVQIDLELEGERAGTVLPGQLLHVRPEITNKGYDCYIRTRYETDILQDYLSPQNIPDKWLKNDADGYWYYTDAVKNGQTIPVFAGILADPSLPQEAEEKTIRFTITAEAVQTQNFTPDYSLDDPWKGTEAEVFAGRKIDPAGSFGTKGLSVVYSKEAKKLIAEPDDFFSNIPDLMPGDVYEQKIRLKNDSQKMTGLYFFTNAKEGKKLLEKISLVIRSGDELIYKGDLASSSLSGKKKAVLLANIPAGGSGECTFTVSVPEELKNEYAQKDSSFVWNFFTDDSSISGDEKPDPGERQAVPSKSRTAGPATGDAGRTGLFLMIFGAALLCLIMALCRRKEKVR